MAGLRVWSWRGFSGPNFQNSDAAIGVRGTDNVPLSGAAPGTWAVLVDAATGLPPATTPVVYEIGATSVYVARNIAAAGQHIAGVVTFVGAIQASEYDAVTPVATPTIASVSQSIYGATQPTATVDYGTDFSTWPDLSFQPISGYQAIGEALYRSLSDGIEGIDLSDYLNDDIDAAGAYSLQQAVRSQALQDERIRAANVAVTQPDDMSLTIQIDVQPADGSVPFKLVLSINQLSVSLLSMQAAQ